MKKILSSIPAVVAMMTMTTVFTACSSDGDGQQPSDLAKLIIDAEKSSYIDVDGEENGTRAIALSGDESSINTSWIASDVVTVFKNDWQSQIGTLSPDVQTAQDKGFPANRTKLEGVITYNNLKAGDKLDLIYPRSTWDYTGQKGTIADISKNFDYITTRVNVVYIDKDNTRNPVYSTSAFFGKAEQTIVKFTLVNADGTALTVPELSITTAGNQLVKKCSLNGKATEKGGDLIVKPESSTNVFYVAIRNDNEGKDQYTLTAKQADGKVLTYTKSDVELVRGNFKKIKVKMKFYDDTYTERDPYYNEDGEEVWE